MKILFNSEYDIQEKLLFKNSSIQMSSGTISILIENFPGSTEIEELG